MKQANAPWWQTAFFGVHYDLHARADDTGLGAKLTTDHLRRELEKVQPDFIQCDCKGHPGYGSYPGKIGTPSPGIVKDALNIFREVTRGMGIPLSIHYSGIWVDGDNWAVRDCYCPRCPKEFAQRTGIAEPPRETFHSDWPAWRAFQRDSFAGYVRTHVDAVHRRKPDCAVCSNWIYTMRQPGPAAIPVDYLSGDFTSSFGCEPAQMEGRYIAGLSLVLPHIVSAAVITWGTPTIISGDSDVNTQGTSLVALNIGGSGTGSPTLNGVTFDAFSQTQ